MERYSYCMNNEGNNIYIFELKLKNSEKITIRRIKSNKIGNLVNDNDNISNIDSLKLSIFNINEPDNIINIKIKGIEYKDNIIYNYNNVIIQIHNENILSINYSLL